MRNRNQIIAILLVNSLLIFSCIYIVLPEGIENIPSSSSKGWSALVTNLSQTDSGDLHIDITIRNETADWSAMQGVTGKPAVLTTSDGKTTNCDTVFIGTGGHRLAPGFQMRGYMTGSKSQPEIQLLFVECKGVAEASGAKLSIDYVSYSGELNYYHQEDNKTIGKLELNLDEVQADLTYPIAEQIEGLIQQPGVEIPAISDNVVTLLDIQRTDTGFQFTWQNFNPTEFALKTHIGNPPVIGEDGIIYGIYEIMDLASVPVTPAGGKVEWTTGVAVPQDVKGFYILLSVESKQMRQYVNHAVDITGY